MLGWYGFQQKKKKKQTRTAFCIPRKFFSLCFCLSLKLTEKKCTTD